MRVLPVIAVLLVRWLAVMSCAGEQTLPAIVPTKVMPLFNGRDLAGLSTWLHDTGHADPRGVFTINNGMIHISGDGFGYLSTTESFREYHLVAEFRWGPRSWRGREQHARDSGIFLHSAGPHGNSFDGNGAYKAAIECQIMQGSVGDLLLIAGKNHANVRISPRLVVEVAPQRDAEQWPYWRPGGRPLRMTTGRINWFDKAAHWRDLLDFRGPKDVEGAGFEWTRVECICAADTIQIRVNGTLVNAAREVGPAEGPILLQCEGSEIFFRKFELHPVEKRPAR